MQKKDNEVYIEIEADLDQDIELLLTDNIPDLELIKDLRSTKTLIKNILKTL